MREIPNTEINIQSIVCGNEIQGDAIISNQENAKNVQDFTGRRNSDLYDDSLTETAVSGLKNKKVCNINTRSMIYRIILKMPVIFLNYHLSTMDENKMKDKIGTFISTDEGKDSKRR